MPKTLQEIESVTNTEFHTINSRFFSGQDEQLAIGRLKVSQLLKLLKNCPIKINKINKSKCSSSVVTAQVTPVLLHAGVIQLSNTHTMVPPWAVVTAHP